jgi:hypothetical protein
VVEGEEAGLKIVPESEVLNRKSAIWKRKKIRMLELLNIFYFPWLRMRMYF